MECRWAIRIRVQVYSVHGIEYGALLFTYTVYVDARWTVQKISHAGHCSIARTCCGSRMMLYGHDSGEWNTQG